jgi:hypothetical protein
MCSSSQEVRKMSRRELTLRGTTEFDLDAITAPLKIFSYEDNDLTRGWKIKQAYVWLSSVREDFGSSTGQFLMQSVLHTDTGLDVSTWGKWGAFDNRIIGWNNQSANERAGNFASNTGSSFKTQTELILDPNHVVCRDLFLSFQSQSDGGDSPGMEWSYMVVLEPMKLTPSETILSIIKSVAQDIDN